MQKKDESKNFKRIWFISYQVAIVCAIVYLLLTHFVKNDKIAYVDSARILNEYKGSKDAKKAYEIKAKRWQANIDTLTNEVKTAIQKYEKSLATLTPKEQELSKELIKGKERSLNDYQRAIQQNAKEEDGKLTQQVVTEINAFLIKYGKEHNYKLILIANQSGTIAYAREGLDISTGVIEELNKQFGEKDK
ncbi:OmpH family outer membrane protein [Mucilaginibacter flavidus]|uniref:OmpH family outer membrane protein n=1 Tax=Mucilaginibacter flavidus TaxID=2949309 RepID=UPI0020922A62|nr:OmpH family outer membrane protein [Mucilaginibacter flavidus]MCO5950590.1 OmpH family outer membrane protein [Mucilaginibacter flavidus]